MYIRQALFFLPTLLSCSISYTPIESKSKLAMHSNCALLLRLDLVLNKLHQRMHSKVKCFVNAYTTNNYC